MSSANNHSPSANPFPLAIVGIGCRFPGEANDVESFWNMLIEGRSGICEVPPDRWSLARYYHPDTAVPGAIVTRHGGFVSGVNQFDAAFWGMSRREAIRMDPQQRWLLEAAWEALENSGTPPRQVRGTQLGVFVGIASSDYAVLQMPNIAHADVHTISGTTLSIAANRVSYMLDLQGPSLSVDTACSSALVAVWLAGRSIWSGACDSAIVGGVNALIIPETTLGFSKASMLSPDGQCFAFDARANGYVRGEGVGVIYIKPLDRALADGNRVYAVLRAAASNQDGHTSSMTVPSADGQAALLREAYQQAGIDPSDVVYIEAHGTGTPVGDPIEAAALGRVVGARRTTTNACLIGSVKTNIGHLEAGSGIAGLIKAALILHKEQIPPNQNFTAPNPQIPFEELGLRVVSRLQALPKPAVGMPVVGINSFGFGGSNAHVVLEQAPAARAEPICNSRIARPQVLTISGASAAALRAYVERFHSLLAEPDLPLADACYTAAARKEHHEHRLAVIGQDASEMRQRLEAWLTGGATLDGLVAGRVAPARSTPVFVYSGQGGQWWRMGRDLLEREPVFRQAVEQIDSLLKDLTDWSLLEEMMRPESESRIDRTDIAQPTIFALQVALTELWQTWGVRPGRVVGHSVGEVAAAYIAGIYSLDDAVKVIVHRARLQHTTYGAGRMAAVGVSPGEAALAIGPDADCVHVAAVNGPKLVTLAGDTEPLEEIVRELERSGKFVRWLRVAYAFHTHQMDPLRDELLRNLAEIRPRSASIPFVSTVTGSELQGTELTAEYWWRNIRQPVLFYSAVDYLVRHEADVFLEVSPHPALTSSIKECLGEHGRTGAVVHSLRRGADESRAMLVNLMGLHLADVAPDWGVVNQSRCMFHRLPSYPWQRETFWLESKQSQKGRLSAPEHPLLGLRTGNVRPTWRAEWNLRRLSFLVDHRFWGSAVFPAAGHVEIGAALARTLFPSEPCVVENLLIKKAMYLDDDKTSLIQVEFEPESKTFSVFASVGGEAGDEWNLHAQGQLTRLAARDHELVDPDDLRRRLPEYLSHEDYYRDMIDAGYQFGPNFKLLQNVWRKTGEIMGEVVVPEHLVAEGANYCLHPTVTDACFQLAKGLDPTLTSDDFFLPASVRRIRITGVTTPPWLWVHGRLIEREDNRLVCDASAYDEQGRLVAEVMGLSISRVDQQRTADVTDQSLYQFSWEPAPPRVNAEANSFPSAAEITAAAKSDLAEAYEKCGLRQYYEQFLPRANAMARRDVRRAWSQLGWRPRVGERITPQDLSDRLGMAPNHLRLTHAHLSSQTACGWLREMGPEAWAVVREPDEIRFDDCWRSLAADYPKFASEAVLLELAGASLATVLQGAVNPVELLFPKGSGDLVERFYDEARDFPVHSQLLHNALRRILTSSPENRRLRVLEIGAGTGSLTRRMIPALHEANAEYVFTDLSPAFIAAGRKKFAAFSFIEYQTFDIEKDPQAQGLKANSFDLVVGSLVVHATSDLKRVLGHLHSCLAPGGMLLFLEAFPPQVSYDHIFGQLPGWWVFSDSELRQHSPLLDRERWIALLDECGFTDAGSFAAEFDEQQADHAYLFAFAPREATVVRRPADKQAGRTYVVFADEGGIGRRIGERLSQMGHPVAYVRAGNEYQRSRAGEYVIDAASAEHLGRVRDVVCHSDGLAGVVHCWCLDHPPASTLSLDTLWASQRTGLLSATQVMLIFADVSRQPIWFITRDGRHVADGDGVEGVASSPLVGLLRVANNERFPSRFGQLDLDGPPDSETLCKICAEVTDSDGELEIAYRRGRRHVLRLRRVQADHLPIRTFNAVGAGGQVTPFRLQTSKPGVLTNLALHQTRRRAPEPHEVEVRVRACGVNFRDALKALGVYPGNAPDLLWFGDDVSGVVERVGKDVCHLQVGDAVVGFADYALQAFVTHNAIKFVKMQRNMSFEQAATVPTVFFTAHYALNRLAQMQQGESILIHAGAGGVGQAAIQVAKHLGLRIFATAGSPEKRRTCQDLGAHHVMCSRNLEFADEIMAITEGRGVDAVLNSLAGDFIPKSLSVLAPFGRYLEIGKIDVYKNTRLGLEALRNNISFFVIDALPAYSTAIFEEIRELLEAGAYRPVMHTCFPITDAAEAFRHIAQGTSIGKNVLSFDHSEIPIGLCTEDSERFDADAAYLISGGAGGFGLELADWMGRRGARYIALLSRGGPRDEEARQKIQKLRLAGVHVLDLRGDVANLDDVKRCVAQVAAVAPLKGVIHAAMVLDDDFLGELNKDRFHMALAPKMAGAWNLHVASIGQPLEHFISFSSVSSVIGAPRQANYNAGNSFLEGLAHYRRARGLPALTINWGLLLGAGYVERNRATATFLESAGQRAISIAEALEAFGRFTLLDIPQVVAARVDWQATSKLCSSMTHSPTFSALMQETSGAARGGSLIARLKENDAGDRAKLVEAFVAAQLAEVVGVKAESIDYDISLNRLGLDSLMALELANRLERELGTSLQMASLLGGPSIKVLAQKVLKSLARQGDSIQSSESHEAQPATTIATPLNSAPARDSTSARRNNGHAAETSGSAATFLRVLGGVEAERELSRQTFEAAALLYAPDRLKTVGGLSDEQIPSLLGEQPFVSHIYELAYGKIGVVTLPVLGKDLLRSPRLPELTRSAIDLARQYGARCVSLTGLIPSATRYGLDVQEWLGGPTPTITTGHATTTAAVILNLESLLLNAGRSLQDETLAVLGLGSIGQTCLELAMRVLPHPRSIRLCDIFGKLKNLNAIAERLRDKYGYHGQVEVLLSADKLPAEFYRATTILTAVSVPNLIDVDRVRPGAILIDDSYPPAFALDQAIKRAETKGDLLFSNAGMSRAPDPIRETVFLSQAAGEEMVRYGADAFRAEFVRDPRELTACFLSSLLTNRFEGFCPTIGLASPDDVLSHFHGLMRMGIGPARPQCGNYLMPDEIAGGFRRRFGSSRLGEAVTR